MNLYLIVTARGAESPAATIVRMRKPGPSMRFAGTPFRFAPHSKLPRLALVAALAAGCSPATPTRTTQVSRIEVVHSGVAEYDRFFAVIRAMQLAINESERVKVDAITRLSLSFGLPEGSELERSAAATRAWSQQLRAQNLQLTIEIDQGPPVGGVVPVTTMVARDDSPAPSGSPAPSSGSPAPPAIPSSFPESQEEAERLVSVEMHVAGGAMPTVSETTARAVRAAIRTAIALKRRMDAIASLEPMIRATGHQLAATVHTRAPTRAAALDAEFRDAIDFLEGAGGRAVAQSQAVFQVALRLQASANSGAGQ